MGKSILPRTLKCHLAGSITFLLLLVLVHLIVQLERQKLQSDEKIELISHGNLLKTAVDRELNSLLYISTGLASYLTVYKDDLQASKIQAILKDLWLRSKHVRNISVTIDTKVTYVYPVERNEQILGKDYRDLPEQWPQVEKAIETKQALLDGPIDLIQGGKGLVYRYPIYIEDEYWGILSTVITTDSFLEAAFKKFKSSHYPFAIRTQDTKQVFYGDPKLFSDPGSIEFHSQVPNGHWEWAIKNIQSRSIQPLILLYLFGAVLSALLGYAVYIFMIERERLTEEALQDSLTKLPNRRLLQDRLQLALNEAKRHQRLLAVMAIDVDHFKTINDTFGHDVGDEVLRIVGRNIRNVIRDSDTVGRIGGDEFNVVLKDLKSLKDADTIVLKIQDLHDLPFDVLGQKIPIHLSIGLAITIPDNQLTINSLNKEADLALYEAKKMGRNTYSMRVLFD